MSLNGNHTSADLELEIMAMLQRLKVAPIVMTRAEDGCYHWEFGSLRGSYSTFIEALEEALGQTMAYLWAVEEERVPDITDIPVSVRANMTEWNVQLLQRRWERKRRERQELFGSS